jgi:hypothetical protein
MDQQIQRRLRECERADDAEWEEKVAAERFDSMQKAFLVAHPPGLVSALWRHFAATRDRCGCRAATHERPECTVRLIERLLLEEDVQ